MNNSIKKLIYLTDEEMKKLSFGERSKVYMNQYYIPDSEDYFMERFMEMINS